MLIRKVYSSKIKKKKETKKEIDKKEILSMRKKKEKHLKKYATVYTKYVWIGTRRVATLTRCHRLSIIRILYMSTSLENFTSSMLQHIFKVSFHAIRQHRLSYSKYSCVFISFLYLWVPLKMYILAYFVCIDKRTIFF